MSLLATDSRTTIFVISSTITLIRVKLATRFPRAKLPRRKLAVKLATLFLSRVVVTGRKITSARCNEAINSAEVSVSIEGFLYSSARGERNLWRALDESLARDRNFRSLACNAFAQGK